MAKEHIYTVNIQWTGNKGQGTIDYKSYLRNYTISIDLKPDLLGSSDPAFRGDPARHNPEDLLVSSLSACHMLWYLHLCAVNHVKVVEYLDEATGKMNETEEGSGYFTEVTLCPVVVVSDDNMINKAMELHQQANKMCFIANSVTFPVRHKPVIKVRE